MRILFSIPALCLLLLVACGNSQNTEIDSVMDKRANAQVEKDTSLYLSLFSPDYKENRKEQTLTIEDIEKNFKSTFPIFTTLQITPTKRSIYLKGPNKAEVFQVLRVTATIEDSKSVFKVSEKIELEKVGEKWLIVKESDSDYFTGYAFGDME